MRKNENCLLFIAITFTLFFHLDAVPAATNDEATIESGCPEIWQEIVVRVSNLKENQQFAEPPSILFVGTDGRIFNCLYAEISPNDLASIQEVEMSRSRSISDLYEENFLPYNFCNVGRSLDDDPKVEFLIYLPYFRPELSSKLCQKVLNQSLRHIKP
ncbi:hypothetical protein [Roseibium sp.]|uniref:hypothetical protein n=1 Tax=Roseibium sp. TaxID=1936156 RepID=UPI003B50661C